MKHILATIVIAFMLGACTQKLPAPNQGPAPAEGNSPRVVSQYCKEVDPTGMNNLLVLVWSDGQSTYGGNC